MSVVDLPPPAWTLPQVRNYARQMVSDYVEVLRHLTIEQRGLIDELAHDQIVGILLQLENLPDGADKVMEHLIDRLDDLGADLDAAAPLPRPKLVWTAP